MCHKCALTQTPPLPVAQFEEHTSTEHSTLDYVYFMQHIATKPDNDLSGCESYVRDKIQDCDPDWFPIEMALALQGHSGEKGLETAATTQPSQEAGQESWIQEQRAWMGKMEARLMHTEALVQSVIAGNEASPSQRESAEARLGPIEPEDTSRGMGPLTEL
jgi:hypothetical protein